MKNLTSIKKTQLKEEIQNNIDISNKDVNQQQKSIIKNNSLHNSIKDNLKETTITTISQKKEKEKNYNFEDISLNLKPKMGLKNKNSKHENIKNKMKRDYIIDINKYHNKRKGKKVKIPKKWKNFISTSKYTWYNFIPKILYEQFSKMSNIYFIIIAFLQCFREISNANGKPIILLPLCIVILVNSIKDFYEDWKRKKSDDEENNRNVDVYDLDKKEFVTKKWKDIFIGNIVKIKKNEYFPADCVLISSSDRKTHNCFVETKNLDGETN